MLGMKEPLLSFSTKGAVGESVILVIPVTAQEDYRAHTLWDRERRLD